MATSVVRRLSQDNSCVQQFKLKLSEYTITPRPRDEWTGRPFVLTPKLREWLNSPAKPLDERNAALLLEYVYRNLNMPAVTMEELVEGSHSCLWTFCILLELNRTDLLKVFRRNDIVDKRLPMDLEQLEKKISLALEDHDRGRDAAKDASDLANLFDQKQWKYFPVEFEDVDSRRLEQPRIFPFIDRQLITEKGATSKVQQIVVPEHFVKGSLRKKAAASKFLHRDFTEIGPCYHFALKVFEDGNKDLFDQEKDAYRTLQNDAHHASESSGMIKYLGDYSHVDGGKASHNILLEYADYDLTEYFYRSPPTLALQIEKFWDDLLHIPKAIDQLHTFEFKRRNKSHKLQGWHADIKPDNILFVREEFKLADPGFAKFRRQDGGQVGCNDPIMVFGGTQTYGAPERLVPTKKISDPSSIDIWSFGCVLSEAATWVALGRAGQNQFTVLRQQAIAKLVEKGDDLLKKGDYFHDGKDVLKEVRDWHSYLREMLRPTDRVTRKVLDLVDNNLLKGEPKSRLKAADLVKKWAEIQKDVNALALPVTTVTSAIEKAITAASDREVDELQIWAKEQDSQDIQGRKAAKSSNLFLQVPGQTKPGGIASVFRTDSAQSGTVSLEPSRTNDSTLSLTDSASARRRRREAERAGQTSPRQPIRGSLSSIETNAGFLGADKTTVFDAYHTILATNHRWKDVLSPNKRAKKDARLAKHIFDRDLIYLVDNAETMEAHWQEVIFVLEILTKKAVNLDPDGVDLCFSNGGVHYDNIKKRSELDEIRQKMMAEHVRPSPKVRTDMSDKLSKILDIWLKEYKQKLPFRGKQKDLTIIVLTDGKWEGMRTKPLAVDDLIKDFNSSFRQADSTLVAKNARPVSIQFISFGNDPDALYRLKRLDDELKFRGVPDIVDTEPSTGDIYQMLLGSIRDDLDGQNDVMQSSEIPGSPPVISRFNTLSRDSSSNSTATMADVFYSPDFQNPVDSRLPQRGYSGTANQSNSHSSSERNGPSTESTAPKLMKTFVD